MQISQNFRIIALFGLLLPLADAGLAQVIRENEKGEKIIVYPDGRMEYFNGEPVITDPSSQAQVPYPVFTGAVEPLDGPVSITEDDLFKISIRRAQLSDNAAQIADARAKQARLNRENLEQQYAQAQDPALRAQLQRQLTAAREVEINTAKESIEAQQLAVRDRALTEKGGFIQAFNERQRLRRASETLDEQRQRQLDRPYASGLSLVENYLFPPAGFDLMLYPPRQDCDFAYEGEDEKTGQYRRDLQRRLLFTYTDERLRPYLKDKDYLRCEGYLSSLGGYRFLTLEFTFAYPNAREAYGFIESGSILTIKLLNGDFINLKSGRMDRGSYDTRREILTYSVYYPIDRGQLGLLRNAEVDFIRVFWSSGYEEYKVYQLDFFQQQLRCLGD
jgi:hypothetical protein